MIELEKSYHTYLDNSIYSLLYTYKISQLLLADFVFVAGPGLEPGSGGYEPPEVPLLYPALLFCLLFTEPRRL